MTDYPRQHHDRRTESRGDCERRRNGRPWSPRELGECIGMSADFVRCEIDSGEIKAVRFGRKLRIPEREIERYLTNKGFPLPWSA